VILFTEQKYQIKKIPNLTLTINPISANFPDGYFKSQNPDLSKKGVIKMARRKKKGKPKPKN
jgi:hypothetical protein